MASQKVYASYQEVIDLHTEANHVSVIGIHTPTGDTPRKMFKGYFDQYKKYKYLGASVTLVPAARLPADPMGISYNTTGQVAGTEMDPRDALNPLMFHGCHGNDMGSILNTLYGNNSPISDSLDGLDGGATHIFDVVGASMWLNMERLYYKALTDKTWKKANPMSGFKKGNLRPLVYSLAANRQIMPVIGDEDFDPFTEGGDPTTTFVEGSDELLRVHRENNLQLFTPRLTGLGWMDTRNVIGPVAPGFPAPESVDDIPPLLANMLDSATVEVGLPKIFMGIILLPPAYGVEQYYRMIVNHRFAFKNFRGISFMPAVDGVPAYTNANPDLFDGSQYEDWNVEEGSGGGDDPEPETPTDLGTLTALTVNTADYTVEGGLFGYYPGEKPNCGYGKMTVDGYTLVNYATSATMGISGAHLDILTVDTAKTAGTYSDKSVGFCMVTGEDVRYMLFPIVAGSHEGGFNMYKCTPPDSPASYTSWIKTDPVVVTDLQLTWYIDGTDQQVTLDFDPTNNKTVTVVS